MRKRTADELETMRANALARAHRYESRALNMPKYRSTYNYMGFARKARQLADELKVREDVMRKQEEQRIEGRDVRELAALCDKLGAEFGAVLRQLHVELTALRQRNGGRGPSALMCWSALERCAMRNFEGTVLRSLRSSPRLAVQLSFVAQIEKWLPSLGTPAPSPSPSPPAQQSPSSSVAA
jgi:hypothetical protein